MLAETRRGSVDARAVMGEHESSDGHAEAAGYTRCATVVMDHATRCDLRIGDRLAHGPHARRRHVARLQKLLPFGRGACAHDVGEHRGLAIAVGVALLIAALNEVGPPKRGP